MIINKSGIAIRMKVTGLECNRRATQGSSYNLGKRNDEIASVCKNLSESEEQDENTEWMFKMKNNGEITNLEESDVSQTILRDNK